MTGPQLRRGSKPQCLPTCWHDALSVMDSNELPDDVQALLRDHIESYEQLELLLLLRAERDHRWTEEALSARLRISSSLLAVALERLKSASFLEEWLDNAEKRYTYIAQSDPIETTLGRLVQAYREHPIPIVKLMSANAIERVRTAALHTFADAFIIRKDKNRG